jgi:hypothetical protein
MTWFVAWVVTWKRNHYHRLGLFQTSCSIIAHPTAVRVASAVCLLRSCLVHNPCWGERTQRVPCVLVNLKRPTSLAKNVLWVARVHTQSQVDTQTKSWRTHVACESHSQTRSPREHVWWGTAVHESGQTQAPRLGSGAVRPSTTMLSTLFICVSVVERCVHLVVVVRGCVGAWVRVGAIVRVRGRGRVDGSVRQCVSK